MKKPAHADSTQPSFLHVTADDIATSIKTLNDPKVRAVFSNNWQEMWTNFIAVANHKQWWERRCSRAEPNYCLPIEFIRSLSEKKTAAQTTARDRSGRKTRVVSKRALFSVEDASAEAVFEEICHRFSPSCVGEWNGHPLIHELLGPFTSYDSFPDGLLMSLRGITWEGTLEHRKQKLRNLDPISARIQRILRHRAGQLLSETKFVRELKVLQVAWTSQPANIPFPLSRHIIDEAQSKDSESLSAETIDFFARVRKFLDRWELTAVCTWDLITPLGPIAMLPVNVNLNALGDIFISNLYPSYWPATDKEEGLFARLQTETSAGLKPIQERILDKPSIFERAYEMRIVEHAFRTRYSPPPRGYIERLIQAFQKRFGVSHLRIQHIRQKYESNLPISSVPEPRKLHSRIVDPAM